MRICNVGQRHKKPSPGRYRVRPLPQAGEVRVSVVGPCSGAFLILPALPVVVD